MSKRQLTGKIDPKRIAEFDFPRVDQETRNAYLKLPDLTGTVSDALDELGIVGVVPGSVLRPTIPGARMAGTALTLRNIIQRDQSYKGAKARNSKLAEIEAHNLAQPGDVFVIEGIDGISNMGGISSTIGKRQGEVGAVVDGSIRDVEQSRSINFPVWSRSVSSITGKWRIETISINDTIEIGGVQVSPGDLVVADEGAVCFVPGLLIADVLKRAQEISEGEAIRYRDIEKGTSVVELANLTYVYQFIK